MKTVLILAVLAVFASGAVVKNPLTRQNLNLGSIGARDRVLFNDNVFKSPKINVIQYEDVLVGGGRTNITAIRATEVGNTHVARAYVVKGGVGQRHVTIRLESARGYGFNYDIVIYVAEH